MFGSQERISEQAISSAGAWRRDLYNITSSSSLRRKLALVGIGHPLRSDDYAGSYLVKQLIKRTNKRLPLGVYLFDGEDSVEVLISKIAELEPEHVVFVDACEMRMKPGEVQLISVTQTSYPFFTTHGVPLRLLAEQLLPSSQVWILAIQPKQTDFGEHLSPEIASVVDSILDLLMASLNKERCPRVDN
jgi:hydrogenase 3 maturation protease